MRYIIKYEVRRDYGGKVLETRQELLRRFSQPEVEACDMPEDGDYLWSWFWELSSQRKGLEPLGFGEILAWSQLVSVELQPWEVSAIAKMDDQYLRTHSEENESVAERQRNKANAK